MAHTKSVEWVSLRLQLDEAEALKIILKSYQNMLSAYGDSTTSIASRAELIEKLLDNALATRP